MRTYVATFEATSDRAPEAGLGAMPDDACAIAPGAA
jgi:hypothetical protein